MRRPLLLLVLVLGCDRRKSETAPVATVPLAAETDAAPPRIEVVAVAPPAPGLSDGGAVSGDGRNEPAVEGPSPEPLAVDVRNASELVLYDTWNGMGNTYAVVIAFRKAGAVFTYQAKVSASPHSLGEPDPEPKRCKCAVTASCKCESESEERPARKRGQIAARAVVDLLNAFGTRPLDLRQTSKGPHWTDDYPYLHMVATVPGKNPVHFTAADQRRHWTRDGKYLYRLPDEPTGGAEREHKRLNAAVQSLEKAIGLDAWVAQEHKKHPNAGRL